MNTGQELKELDIMLKKYLFVLGTKHHLIKPPSPLQVRILLYIMNHKNEVVCQKDLEHSLHISKAAISEALAKLEKEHMIIRVNNEKDGRSKKIEISEGVAVNLQIMQEIFAGVNETLIKGINKKDLDIFYKVLKQMKENIKEGENNV